ncbi:MAG TPA: hypothetical protein VN833_14295 [Candidatus Acidoferrales bacterium]|nr:hypothetical protein [Candidatus Acidoferrales bacterium]
MSDPKVSASDGSTAIGGDANAPIFNLRADTINLSVQQQTELSSFLGHLIVSFAQQSLSEYGTGARRAIPPEVSVKVNYNNFPPTHRLIVDWSRHEYVLEQAYKGVEQQNADARYLVRRKAAFVYESLLTSISPAARISYVRANASALVNEVVALLLESYKKSSNMKVEEERAHLAVSLVVADAIVECEVLERPEDAITT